MTDFLFRIATGMGTAYDAALVSDIIRQRDMYEEALIAIAAYGDDDAAALAARVLARYREDGSCSSAEKTAEKKERTRRACMCCGAVFMSDGPHNRLC